MTAATGEDRRPHIFGGRLGAVSFLLLVLLAITGCGNGDADGDQNAKPRAGLMTSLPLAWGKGDLNEVVRGESAPEPAYRELEQHFELVPLDDLEAPGDANMDLLILAQPRRLSPEELVAVDRWVREGGRALIFADPALQWESDLALGDKRRPLFTSLLSPLLSHWGLELLLPMDRAEMTTRLIFEDKVLLTAVPGIFQAQSGDTVDADCAIHAEDLIARCAVGKGRVEVIADADLLDSQFWQADGWWQSLTGAPSDNMDYVVARALDLAGKSAS